MKNFLHKKPMLLLCALLLFSLGCMGVLAVAEPKSTGSTAETVEMTEGAVPLAGDMEEVSEATSSNARTVWLDPGDGTLEGSIEIKVDKETGKILSSLPTPISNRKEWEFAGWYTAEIAEPKYLAGGDTIGDGVCYSNGDLSEYKHDVLGALKKDLEGTNLLAKLENDYKDKGQKALDAAITAKHHSWLMDTSGEKVVDKVDKNVGTLYAMYAPKTVKIHWDYDGWKNNNGALDSSRSYGAYAYASNLSDASEWGDRKFEGWSFTQDGPVALLPGYVYEVGGAYLTPEKLESGSVTLYAVWSGGEGRKVTDVNVKILTGTGYAKGHAGSQWRYDLGYSLLPTEAIPEQVTWSIVPEGAGYFIEQKGSTNRNQIVVDVATAKARKLTSVTVKVTTASGVVGEVNVPLEHSWNRTYTFEPTCLNTGWATDKCWICGTVNQPTLPKAAHEFSTTHTPATCTEPGYAEKICKVCGAKEVTEEKPALGHKWGDEKTVEICGGIAHIHTCQTCGVTESDVDVNSADHQWSTELVIDQEPTCGQAGSRSYHCLKCNLTKDSEIIPPDPSLHNWSRWSVIEKPQVGVVGMQRRTCGNCWTEETEDIPALLPSPEALAEKGITGEVEHEPVVEELPETEPAPEEEDNKDTAEVPTSPSTSGSSSGGSSGGGGGSRGSSGGGGGGGSRSSSGGGAAKTGAGPSAGAAATPLPVVPTAEIRAALPTYVEVGTWDKAADGTWTCKDESGQPYTNRWAAVYNPYANTAAADAFDWFRFDQTGHLITGWYVDPVDGNTYYMNEASDGTQGKMMTGWQWIDGKEYYFNPNSDGQRGRMYRNEATPDGHFVGPDGAKVW